MVFDRVEIMTGQVFEFKSRIVPYDGSYNAPEDANTRHVRTRYIRAENAFEPQPDSRIFNRLQLDEDPDLIPTPARRGDEWFAKVTASPVVFENMTQRSELVTGNWGGV